VGYNHGPACDLAVLEVLIGLGGVVEAVGGDLRADQAPGTQVEHLGQLGTGSPVGGLDADLVGNREERHGEGTTADADNGEVAHLPGHRRPHRQGGVGSDEVENDVGAASA